MSKANITLHILSNQENFLKTSEAYLDLYHGDTSSHPYVTDFHSAAHADVKATPVKAVVPQAHKPSVTSTHMNWHAQYCLNKFGKMTPGF